MAGVPVGGGAAGAGVDGGASGTGGGGVGLAPPVGAAPTGAAPAVPPPEKPPPVPPDAPPVDGAAAADWLAGAAVGDGELGGAEGPSGGGAWAGIGRKGGAAFVVSGDPPEPVEAFGLEALLPAVEVGLEDVPWPARPEDGFDKGDVEAGPVLDPVLAEAMPGEAVPGELLLTDAPGASAPDGAVGSATGAR